MKIQPLSMSEQMRMIKGVEPIYPRPGVRETETTGDKKSFTEMFVDKLSEVNKLGLDADSKMMDAVSGKSANPHEAIIAMQKRYANGISGSL